MSYQQPPDYEADGYPDQSDRALHRWYSAQPGQQTQPPPERPEPRFRYRPQPYDQQLSRNPSDQSDPGQRQGQPSWQDQAYQGQPYQAQPSYPRQQPHGQQDVPQAQQPRQYGQGPQGAEPPKVGRQPGHRAQASWPSRHKVLSGVIAVAALLIAGSIGAAAGKGSASSGGAAPAPTVTVTQTQQQARGPAPTVTVSVRPATNAQGEATQISDGVYVVGTKIAGGTWHTSGGSRCYEATLSGLNPSDAADIIQKKNFTGPDTVSLAGAEAFDITGGCAWRHEG